VYNTFYIYVFITYIRGSLTSVFINYILLGTVNLHYKQIILQIYMYKYIIKMDGD